MNTAPKVKKRKEKDDKSSQSEKGKREEETQAAVDRYQRRSQMKIQIMN